ncbi:MAG TPA: TMEM175 family protein [Thermotogota bacterium]|nr:TMEM175 family protein [Thermotogota bacterium]
MFREGQSVNSGTTEEHKLSRHRLEALFDGTLAIVMTLMILDLKIPEDTVIHDTASFLQVIGEMHVTFIKYLISFFVLASVWVSNNYEFYYVEYTDKRHLWLSLTGLFFIVLIPFTTSLQDDFSGILLAEIIFHTNMFFIQFFLFLRWKHLIRHQNLLSREKTTPEILQDQIRIVRFKMLIPLIGILLTFISYDYSNLIYLTYIFLRDKQTGNKG